MKYWRKLILSCFLLIVVSGCQEGSPTGEDNPTEEPVFEKSATLVSEKRDPFSLIFPFAGEVYETSLKRVELVGETDASIEKIVVEFSNEEADEKEVYTLQKFQKGDKEWKYAADYQLDNFYPGLNTYIIKAYYSAEDYYEEKAEIKADFEVEPTPIGAQEGKVIDAVSSGFAYANIFLVKNGTDKKKSSKLIFEPEDNFPDIIVWQDYLIYADGTSNEVMSYNFKTEEEKQLFKNNGDSTLRYLQIIDEVLYIMSEQFGLGGEIYWISLSANGIGKAQKLMDCKFCSFDYYKGWYWLREVVFADADYCEGKIYLFDPETKEASFITGFSTAGRKIIERNRNGKIILAQRDVNGRAYLYVETLSIADPKKKEILISEEEMPKGVNRIEYEDKNDRLVLIKMEENPNAKEEDRYKRLYWNLRAKQTWVYDLDSGELTEEQVPTPVPISYSELEGSSFEEEIQMLELPSGYEFVIEEITPTPDNSQ